jgi:prophage regulatory protein
MATCKHALLWAVMRSNRLERAAMDNDGQTAGRRFGAAANDAPTAFLRWPEVVRRVGMSKSSVITMIRENRFPKPVQIGDRARGFVASEVESHLAQLVERSRAHQ